MEITAEQYERIQDCLPAGGPLKPGVGLSGVALLRNRVFGPAPQGVRLLPFDAKPGAKPRRYFDSGDLVLAGKLANAWVPPPPRSTGIRGLRVREHQNLWFQRTYRQNIPAKGLSLPENCLLGIRPAS